ncbi:MAG: proteasome accessory factor PafA2 family protein [Fimbriimonadaceae bacterium]|nr:proteasome accessory factor PafA2 family protein [Fimbriimonadaceae bacterium]
MHPVLVGLETEYGLSVEGRGAEEQIDDSMALVRSYPGECFVGWDYRFESPRSDLRGFQVEHLAYDPEDARFDAGRARPGDQEVRSDRILPNGARFYNDHGHPEFATPECRGAHELARHDKAGEQVVAAAAAAFARQTGRKVKVYKNNTDFHGASYGTHESYLVPRRVGFERLFQALVPLFVSRQVLTGAGKVGYEHGSACPFQMSQRADFFVEPANIETLYRRPVFNTRDEPHADPSQWVRLHVICGDANRMFGCTRRKVALVRLALALVEADAVPTWRLSDPVRSFAEVSRAVDDEGRIGLEGSSWTTPRLVVESYLDAAERLAAPDEETLATVAECRDLLEARANGSDLFRRNVDWAAKRWLLDQFREDEGLAWHHPAMQSLDLAYCDIDPAESLFDALVEAGEVDGEPSPVPAVLPATVGTRPWARGLATSKFGRHVRAASWGSLAFQGPDGTVDLRLDPVGDFNPGLADVESWEEFCALVQDR